MSANLCPEFLGVQVFGITIYSLVAVCVLVVTCIYIKAYATNELKASRSFFYLAAVFFVMVIGCCISWIIIPMFVCHSVHYAPRRISVLFGAATFQFQTNLLLILLSIRLSAVFKDSEFAVSKRTIGCLVVLFVVQIVAGWISTVFVLISFEQFFLLVTLTGTLNFLLRTVIAIWLNILFISRLLKVCAAAMDASTEANDVNQKLFNIATNGTLLCLISTSSEIVYTIVWLYAGQSIRPMDMSLLTACLALDLITNAFSILFSFKVFNAWYLRVCGCCHRRCQSCIKGRVQRKHGKAAMKLEKELEASSAANSVSPTSPSQD